MIDDFKGLVVFVVVIEVGSFSVVGWRFNLLILVVSYYVLWLEFKLGVLLFFCFICVLFLISEGYKILDVVKCMVSVGSEVIDVLVGEID